MKCGNSNTYIIRAIIIISITFLGLCCENTMQGIDENKAISIASEFLISRDEKNKTQKMSRFPEVSAKYQSKGNTWLVRFARKPAMPGGTFFVKIDAKTGAVIQINGGR